MTSLPARSTRRWLSHSAAQWSVRCSSETFSQKSTDCIQCSGRRLQPPDTADVAVRHPHSHAKAGIDPGVEGTLDVTTRIVQ